MRLNVRICDPYGVVLWEAEGPVTEGIAATSTPAGRAELRALLQGTYLNPAGQPLAFCEVVVAATTDDPGGAAAPATTPKPAG